MSDIIQPRNNPEQSNNFYERWDERKARILAEKARAKDGHKRRIGRPRKISDEAAAKMAAAFISNPNVTDIARIYKIDRHSVVRIFKRIGFEWEKHKPKSTRRTAYMELSVVIDLPVHAKIKSAAALRNRTVSAEIRATLNKFYDT